MWLLPSKGRPALLKRCLDKCLETGLSTPGVVILDSSDETKEEYYNLMLPKDWSFFVVDDGNPNEPTICMGKSLREWFRLNQEYVKTCKWIGALGDDQRPVTQNWDTLLTQDAEGYIIIAANDNWLAPTRLTGPTVWSGDMVRLVGGIFPPGLHHMYVDNYWEVIGLNTGTWCHKMAVVVEHDHWTKHQKPDQTSLYAETFILRDKELFGEWYKNDALALVDKIKQAIGPCKYKTGVHLSW